MRRRIEGSRVRMATSKALAEDADLLDAEERARIDAALAAVDEAERGTDARRLLAAIDALETATHDFAGRRMDRAIGRALSGKDVGSIERDTEGARGLERAHEPLVGSADETATALEKDVP